MPGEDVLYELAARLGSIDTFDRHGDTVWMDGFEEGVAKWEVFVSGTGAAVTSSTTTARNGGYSAKLTAGSTLAKQAAISHPAPFTVVTKVGFEASFTIHEDTDYIEFRLTAYTGTLQIRARLRYTLATTTLAYYDENGAYQTLTSLLDLYVHPKHFHTVKLVLDLEAQEYVRVNLDGTQYDLAGVDAWVDIDTGNERLETQVWHIGVADANPDIYVDDVIVTQDEPG